MGFIKWCLKSLIIGLLLLFFTNIIGTFIDINIPINVFTIAILAIFRLSGLVVLIIFYKI